MLGRLPSQSTAKFFHLVCRVWKRRIYAFEQNGHRPHHLVFKTPWIIIKIFVDLQKRVSLSRAWNSFQSYRLSMTKLDLEWKRNWKIKHAYRKRRSKTRNLGLLIFKQKKIFKAHHSSLSPHEAIVVVESERIRAWGERRVGVELFQKLKIVILKLCTINHYAVQQMLR